MVKQKQHTEIYELLSQVVDPEIPVLSILDIGVLRDVAVTGTEVLVTITPTYSGCPAMDVIGDDIVKLLAEHGYHATIKLVLAPAWTTDWITEAGRKKMQAYGIAAPLAASADKKALMGEKRMLTCTRCGSTHTEMISPFGSTACKALFKCLDCLEPFDYFKCL